MTPMVTDWIMVAITTIYVIATICIMRSNKESAEASKEQLQESKLQFDEMRRLGNMPFLQLELNRKIDRSVECILELPTEKEHHGNLLSHIGVLRNIGNGTAMNIVYSWRCKEKGITNADALSVNAIRYGDSYKVELLMDKIKVNEVVNGILTFSFQDLIGNEYEQKMYISCQGYDISIDIDTPSL